MKFTKIAVIALLSLQTFNIFSNDFQKTAINTALFLGAYHGFNTMLTCIHEASHRSTDILLRDAKEHRQIKLENLGVSAYTVSTNKKDSESLEEFKKKEIINLVAGPTIAAGFSLLTYLLCKSSLIGQLISLPGFVSELSNLIPGKNLNGDGSKIYTKIYNQLPTTRATIIGRTLLTVTAAGIFYITQNK